MTTLRVCHNVHLDSSINVVEAHGDTYRRWKQKELTSKFTKAQNYLNDLNLMKYTNKKSRSNFRDSLDALDMRIWEVVVLVIAVCVIAMYL